MKEWKRVVHIATEGHMDTNMQGTRDSLMCNKSMKVLNSNVDERYIL